MKPRTFLSYLVAAAMFAGTLALPVTASAHGYGGHGPYGQGFARRHQPAPKWRNHRGYARMGREYRNIPRRRGVVRAYDTAPRVGLRRGRTIGFAYPIYWD